jgi:sugar phosphate isomerase/epimerase
VSDPLFGAFARIWRRAQPSEVAEAMAAGGAGTAQWNFSAIGQPSVSANLQPELYSQVRKAFDHSGVGLWGLSCSHNLTHPDADRRRVDRRAAQTMISRAPILGVEAITICAGSRDIDGWTWHPENGTESAWREMRCELDTMLDAAAGAGVMIAVEPEPGCIVSDTARACRLLHEVGEDSPLGFVLDPSNLVADQPPETWVPVLDDAFSRLGHRCLAVHAKDPLGRVFPDRVIDYRRIAARYARFTPGVPVVVQDVDERDFSAVLELLGRAWAERRAVATRRPESR